VAVLGWPWVLSISICRLIDLTDFCVDRLLYSLRYGASTRARPMLVPFR